MTGTYIPPRKPIGPRQQSMYELDSGPYIGTETGPGSVKRNRRGKRGKRGSGAREAAGEMLAGKIKTICEGWYPELMLPLQFRAALTEGSQEFLSAVCACLANDKLKVGPVRLLIEMDAWKASNELRELLKTYIATHPTEVSRICSTMQIDGYIALTERSSIEHHPHPVHVFKAGVTVIGTDRQLVISGAGPNYKDARTKAYQQMLLLLCGFDNGSAVANTELDTSPIVIKEIGGLLPTPVIQDNVAPRCRHPEEMFPSDSFRAALIANSSEFIASVSECLRNDTLKPGNVQSLIEMEAWKASDELTALLQAYILSHPTEVSHICGKMRNDGFISLTQSSSVEHSFQTRHFYKADVTVDGSYQQLTITGTGPSYQIARTFAYQRLLLQLCGSDVESTLPDPKQNPWLTFLQDVGGRAPTTELVDEVAPRSVGYQATASFNLNGREWHSLGVPSPWKIMARQTALDELFLMVTTDLNWEQ